MGANPLTNFLTILAQGLLIIALPIIIAVAFQDIWKVFAELKLKVGSQQHRMIETQIMWFKLKALDWKAGTGK